MAVPISDDAEEELRLIGEWERNWEAAVVRGSHWTPAGVEAVAAWAERSPWMEPEAILSLARSGVTPDSETGMAASQAAGGDYFTGWRQGREPTEAPTIPRRSRAGRSFWSRAMDAGTFGRHTAARQALGNDAVKASLMVTPLEQVIRGDLTAEELLASAPDATWEMVAELHNQAVQVRNLLRDEFGDEWLSRHLDTGAEGAAQAPVSKPEWMNDEQWRQVEGHVTRGEPLPDRVDPAVQNWLGTFTINRAAGGVGDVNVPADVASAVAEGRFDPSALSADMATRLVQEARGERAQGFENPVVPVARVAFMALNAPLQELQGSFRSVVSDVRRNGWAAALNPLDESSRANLATARPQSDLGIAAEQLAAGRPVDTGSGFFVSPESAVGQARLRRERSYGTIGGQVITPGRWAVDAFTGLDPGDTGFGAASGLIDFAVAVGADPIDWAGGAILGARRGARLFDEAGTLGRAADAAVPAASSRYQQALDRAAPPAADEINALGVARVGDTDGRPFPTVGPAEDVTVDDLDAIAQQAARRPVWTRPNLDREANIGVYSHALEPNTDPATLSGWLLAGDGRQVVERIAAESDFYSLWKGTKGKIDPQTLLRLADTADPDEVTGVLFDALRLRGDRTFTYNPPNVNRGSWTRRAFSDMPVNRLRTDNPAEFLTGLDSMLTNARVPQATIAARIRQAAEAPTTVGRVGVFEQGLDDIADALVARGVPEQAARAVTGHIEEYARTDRLFNTRDGIETAALPEQQVFAPDGRVVHAEPRAHLAVEMAPEMVQVPNIREIRRLSSWMQKVGPLFVGPEGDWQALGRVPQFLDGLSTNVWKRLTLLRVAWPVRQVLIDEQGRMAAAGVPSIWRHPVHLLASLMVDGRTEARMLGSIDEANGAFLMADEYQASLLRGGVYDPIDLKRTSLGIWRRIEKGQEEFTEAWGRELGQLAADPIASRLAGGKSVQAVVDDLMAGDLADLRADMTLRHLPVSMADEAGVRNYVESVWSRLRHKTGENPELMEAVAEGFLRGDGKPLFFSHPGTWEPTDGFADRLAGYLDSAPDAVKGERRTAMTDRIAGLENATNRLFHLLGSAPSNKLSRAPAWRWYYFESLAERMPMLTREAQEKVIEQAGRYRIASGWSFTVGDRTIGVGDKLLERLKAGMARGADPDGADFETAQMFGRIEAMERTKRLLGDLSTRNQMADAFRVIAPFGSAWREAMTAYARLVKANPLVVYDVMKGVQGAMESGFFYRDPNGELVFAYPGSAQLMSAIPGAEAAPFPLTGRVQGLTMGFEVFPGLGPVATFPLAHAIPDTPKWDGLRELLIPYGTEAGIQILVPEWAEKMSVALRNSDADGPLGGMFRSLGKFLGGDSPESIASFNSSVVDVATYLISTGEYDLTAPGGMDDLLTDARDRAVHLWFWRGLAQSTVPSAPRWNTVFDTGDGDTVMVAPMLERLQQLREEDPLHASQRFLDEFGELAFGILSPKTQSNALYVPYDEEGFDWVRDHSDLMDRYPEIGALFAPRGGGPAGIGAYMRRLESGQVESVDPADWLNRGQDALASVLYNTARDNAERRAAEAGYESVPQVLQDELRDYRRFLIDTYPGYLADTRTAPDITRTIGLLDDALQAEEVFRDSDAGRALALYLDARDNALARISAETDARSLSAEAAAPIRQRLRAYGAQLVQQHPDFINLWERVFSREVELADEEAQ